MDSKNTETTKNLEENQIAEGEENPDGKTKEEEAKKEKKEKINPFYILVKIAPDYLSATVDVDVMIEGETLKRSDLEKEISKKNIKFGIDQLAIDKIVKDPKNAKSVVVAKGVPFIHGKDGKVEYMFDTNAQAKPTINEDGSVDFKNMNFFQASKRGQILAVRELPTKGQTGTLVTGKTMKGKDGKIVNFKIGKNVYISEDGLAVISGESGTIEFTDSKISVLKALNINSDVGVETGNIKFQGKVVVEGNVRKGFKVEASDDIIINGLVEDAVVISEKDITVKYGVQGEANAYIEAGGNLVSKFINAATVVCKGHIESDAIMHCDLVCHEHLKLVGSRGLLVGGKAVCRKGIYAKKIGTEMGTKTIINIGLDQSTVRNYNSLNDRKKEISNSINEANQMLKIKSNQKNQAMALVAKKKAEKIKEEQEKNFIEITKEIDKIEELIEELKTSKLQAEDIYPGVRIKFGNSFYNIKERMLQIELVKENYEIKLKPLTDEEKDNSQ